MRSLTIKLVLAFLLTSVAGVALASLFIRQFVTREFDTYVIEQQRDGFIAAIGSFYQENGSWNGLERWLRSRAASQRSIATPGPGLGLRVRFGLAGADGTVILPFGGHLPGERAGADELAGGAPVLVDGRAVGTVITPDLAAFRNVAEQRYLARTDTALGIAAAVMIGVALLLGVLLARLITRPVRELTAAARQIAGGDLEQQVPVRSRDELGVLSAQFNHMSAGLARATQLRRRMTADVAHDLRTPLTVIAGYLEALRDNVLKPTPERFAAMYSETQLLLHLVEDLHTLSLADAGELSLQRARIAPRQLLERVASTYQHAAEQGGVALRVCADDDLPEICADAEQLTRALGNLVSNALRYTPPGGTIVLGARCETNGERRTTNEAEVVPFVLRPSSFVVLDIRDTGVGIAAEHLPAIFERFYRADPSRQEATGGSGLGLAIVKSIVEAHGGQVGVESVPGQGTTFTIALPVEVC
jgi:signal transduction histidine kinase